MTDNSENSVKFAAVIPVKKLANTKSRLNKILSIDQRVSLTLSILETTLAATRESALDLSIVLGSDHKVNEIANRSGAKWVYDGGNGLNKEVDTIFDRLSSKGFCSIYIAADLPLLTAQGIDNLIAKSGYGRFITFCPAKRDNGTNGLLLPPDITFLLLLGNRSYSKHIDLAKKSGLEYRICESEGWGTDLDCATDLNEITSMDKHFLENSMKHIPGEDT